MQERTLKKFVRKWLKEEWYPEKKYEICKGTIKEIDSRYPQFDLYVRNSDNGKVECIIECKGSRAFLYTVLGQCMCYYWYCSAYPFYLAIPEDYSSVGKSDFDLEDVQKIMTRNKSRFGLLSVSSDGKVECKKDYRKMDRSASI